MYYVSNVFTYAIINAVFPPQDRDVHLSKSMSYALRHGANKMGLQLGSGEALGPALGKLVHKKQLLLRCRSFKLHLETKSLTWLWL